MLITDKNNSKLILKIILTLGSSKQSVIDREAERALEEKAGINYTKIQRVNKSLICIGSWVLDQWNIERSWVYGYSKYHIKTTKQITN